MFVRYPHCKNRWELYNLKIGEIFASHNVKFYENRFPYAEASTSMSIDLESTFSEEYFSGSRAP